MFTGPMFGDDIRDEGLWAENADAANAFLAVAGQWRFAVGPDGRVARLSLDYAGVRAGLELAGIAMTPALWDDLRLIEQGAIAAGAGR